MGQYLSWLANGVLFVLCCYLIADTANEVFAALLTPTAEDVPKAPAPASLTRRAWADREIILKRNLFNASLLAPAIPVEEPVEDLDATKLPLRLLGTAASTLPELSWAAVEDESERRTVIVRVSDNLNKATVQRIERRRIVLSENGVLRELVLDDDESDGAGSNTRRRTVARHSNRKARSRSRNRPTTPASVREKVEKLADDRFKVERDDVDDLMRNPANLFSQARILPKYEDGEMIGLQINAIKPGSLFEDIGIQSGDVITKLNGISINNPQESAKILAEFSESDEFDVDLCRTDGSCETLNFVIPE
jgi:general secretion pathway protein C